MDSTRLGWMDFARGLCILLVILMHATGTVEAAGLEPPAGLTLFNQALEPFRMPLLMFLSGMLLSKSLDKPPAIRMKIRPAPSAEGCGMECAESRE